MSGPPPEPRANPDLVGHEAAERAVADAFASGRMPHAWLIAGPRGIGKATFAYRAARWVLAGAPDADGGLRVDPDTPVFRRVASAGHADMMTLERQVDPDRKRLRAEIVVADVRRLGAFLGHTAAEGGWRVVVVDAVDEMNRHAANAVLKILEEPPARVLMLLVCHAPGRVPATVRSRCRRLALAPLDDDAVRALVRAYRPDVGDADAATLARLADGSVGRALALAEEGALDLHGELARLLDGLPDLDVAGAHRLGDRVGAADGPFALAGDLVRWWLARIVRAAAGAAVGGGATPGEAALVGRLAGAATLDRWLEVWDKTNALLGRAVGASLDRKQVLIGVLVDLENAVRR